MPSEQNPSTTGPAPATDPTFALTGDPWAPLPSIVFTLKGGPSTHVRPYLRHFVAEAVLMETLLDMGLVMSDVAEWHVDTGAPAPAPATPAPSPCCRCCEAAQERGELDHAYGNRCPHPPCDYCQGY